MSLSVGDFRVTLIRESIYYWDGGALFGVVPRTLWCHRIAPDECNRVPLGLNCYLIETGEHTVLVETGAGDKLDERTRRRMRLPPESRPLSETIAAHGFDPERIDVVLNSHLHWDHCGGNTAGECPAFPRAVYYARRGEWEHARSRHPRDSVSYDPRNYDPLVHSGQMRLFDGECEPVPGIRMRHAPGHNADMMIVTAESRGETFCFLSDLVPTVHHVTPTWVAAFDLFPLTTIDNKIRILAQAAAGNWVCGFAHDAGVAFARIRGGGRKFEAEDVGS